MPTYGTKTYTRGIADASALDTAAVIEQWTKKLLRSSTESIGATPYLITVDIKESVLVRNRELKRLVSGLFVTAENTSILLATLVFKDHKI